MSNHEPNATSLETPVSPLAIDAGLRTYMLRIYNYMAGGVGLTAVVAWLTYQFTTPHCFRAR